MSEWSTERMAEQFRREIAERFSRENAAWRVEDDAEIAEVKAQFDAKGQPYPDWLLQHRPSFFTEIYERVDIRIESNCVQIVLPKGFALFPELIEMFDGTSVAWSKPHVDAILVDGEPRVTIELFLIDYWDDERHAKWLAERAQWKGTTAEDLLRRIANARNEFAQSDPPKRPVDGLPTIEHWIDEYFQARRDK